MDYEQSLNKAVNKLREALGDSADNPVYIETVARRGYRFVAPVAVERPVLVDPEAPKEVPISKRKAPRLRARLGWAAGLLTAALLVTGLWPAPVPRARVTQLTHGARPARGLAVHDGRILYVSQFLDPESNLGSQFYSTSTEGGEPRRERMPFLDPKAYAYLAVSPRQDTIMIMPLAAVGMRAEPWLAGFDGSKPRRMGEVLPGSTYSVSPDLKTLLIANKSGLLAHPVDGAPERLIARIDWNAPSYTFWHPSGERIGFFPIKNGLPKLWEVRMDGGGMRALLPEFPGEQVAASWSPDGERLYFVSKGELYVLGGWRWLGWMRRPEPQRLTTGSVRYDIASEDPADARVIYTEGLLAHGEAMKLNRKTGVFETYLDGLSAECLAYSPDGQWIAYVSYPDRELWKCRRDGSDKVLLEDGLLTYNPRWSPDGKRLAFAAVPKDEWRQAHRIYTIAGDGGKSELVKGVNGPGFDPTWSPDGKELVYAPWDYEVGSEAGPARLDRDPGDR